MAGGTKPKRVVLKSGKRPLRPAPVVYRKRDEVDYLRAARRALVDPLDALIREVRDAPLDVGQRIVGGGQYLQPSMERAAYLERVVDARSSRLTEYSGRRWRATMKGTLSADKLKAGDEAVDGLMARWRDGQRVRLNASADIARQRIQRLDVTDKQRLLRGLRRERDIAYRRARTVTRNGVQEANGSMNQVRQQAANIRSYIWVSKRDERVRPDHQRLDRSVRRWDQSPVPGGPPNCRCVGVPNIKPG